MSKRSKSLSRSIKRTLSPWLLNSVTRLLWKTCKIETVLGSEHADKLVAAGKPVIPCYWHQQQIFCLWHLLSLQERGLALGYLISPSSDGEVATKLVRQCGIHIIRGSATRGGAQVMREIFTAIKKQQISPIITPDGPRGPKFECKQGVAMLSQLSGAPMLPMGYAASRYWQLSSWDDFILPKPFSRIVVGYGAPMNVEKSLPVDKLEIVCEEMTDRIMQVTDQTRQHFESESSA
ncbi:MAG: lysophospholipid acyltransferase family protein [Granulosicoccus sp.]|nr:lysophospholipid acyltransferase family protein [Granulosicoccus sp.]